jgi:hypothetical protein
MDPVLLLLLKFQWWVMKQGQKDYENDKGTYRDTYIP